MHWKTEREIMYFNFSESEATVIDLICSSHTPADCEYEQKTHTTHLWSIETVLMHGRVCEIYQGHLAEGKLLEQLENGLNFECAP